MHGRLKVRTSAEAEIQKKLKQEEKLKQYIPCLARIFAKRKAGELDNELIQLTGAILCSNSDFSTLFNIRKECFLELLQNPGEHDLVDLFNRDLEFTEACLRTNPKSYGAWHHRCWLLEHHPEADYKKEVVLTTRYLKMDERNFHCWDYRRHVVEKAQIEPEDELKFCTEKIQQNFSNYSSWHYRSKLLPELYPNKDPIQKGWPITEEKLKSELEMVLTAAFTDPKDSSAWFYQRWLLGYVDKTQDIVSAFVSKEKAIVSFAQPINLKNHEIKTGIAVLDDSSAWKSTNGLKVDLIWYFDNENIVLPDKESIEVSLFSGLTKITSELKKNGDEFYALAHPSALGGTLSEPVVEEFKSQLSSCEQLLEFEPESKWTLLTAALLMRAIDSEEYHQRTIENLEKLKTVDSLRLGYYDDLITKWNIEGVLAKWLKLGDIGKPIDFSSLNLSCLYYEQYYAIAKIIKFSEESLPQRIAKKMKIFKNI